MCPVSNKKTLLSLFMVLMKTEKTYCVKIDDFKPFFYIKVGHNWSDTAVYHEYFDHIREISINRIILVRKL